jgi:hypothetical protein
VVNAGTLAVDCMNVTKSKGRYGYRRMRDSTMQDGFRFLNILTETAIECYAILEYGS